MGVTPALRVALYLLVADGISALYVSDFIGPLGTALIGAALGASWWSERLRERVAVRIPVGRALVPIAALASAVDVLYLAATVLDGLVRLLLFLVFYKLFTLRSVRDTRTVSFLAFFMLVSASASAFGVGFLFVFVAFVVLATWVTLLQHLLVESEPGPGRVPVGAELRVGHGRALLGVALAASGGIIAITAGFFFVLPRVGLAALPLRARLAQMVTGFSDRVELGAYGAIATDATVVMRVHVTAGIDDPEQLPNLRWRGIVLDEFDGRAWSVRHPRRIRLLETSGGGIELGVLRGAGPVIRQEIYLEPLGTEVIFAAPRVLRLGLRSDVVTLDDMGSVSVPPPSARLSYTVESQLEGPAGPRAPGGVWSGPLDPSEAARYVQLPPLPARIPALARQVAADSRDPREAALRLTDFLSREFRYTLTLERVSTLDPLEEFLFVRRAGHCEYFAAALAVMLRSLGIPARVVNGFQRGEWNPYGRYFMVRLRDAHSWVEAYVGGGRWVTLDPSPRAAVEAEAWGAPGSTFLYLDALRLQWHRYVINWSLRDQLRVANTIQRHASGWAPWLAAATRRGERSPVARWAIAAVVAGGAGLALLLWWRDRPTAGAGTTASPPKFYERAVRIVARHGLRPEPAETAREFSVRVGQLGPTCAGAFGRLTVEYERCRFGAARLTTAELAELQSCLTALDRGANEA